MILANKFTNIAQMINTFKLILSLTCTYLMKKGIIAFVLHDTYKQTSCHKVFVPIKKKPHKEIKDITGTLFAIHISIV